MESLSPLSTIPPSQASQFDSNSLQDVELDSFLKLMIAELQNQDPLDPMDNSEMLQQLSQIRSIGATDHLTDTLEAVLIGQNLTTAGSLIGKEVNALSDGGENIRGTVDRVTVVPVSEGTSDTVRVHVGEHSVALQNVREILPQE